MEQTTSRAPELAPERAQPGERTLPRPARLVLFLFLAFGTYVRTAGVWNQALYGDEKFAHKFLAQGYAYLLTHFDVNGGSHVPLTLLERAAMDLFGPTVLSYRLPSVIAGLLGLWLLYPLGRHLVGRGPAWLATLLLAVHPMHVFYSRFARAYTIVFLLALVLVFSLVRALEGRRRAWIGVALASALLPWVHLTTTTPVAVLTVVAIALAWRQPGRPALRVALIAAGAGALLCLALYAPAIESLIESLQWRARLPSQGVSITEVLALLGGSASGGWLLAITSVLACLVLARRGKPAGALFLALLVTPAVTIWFSGTIGRDTAYARYQFAALVPLLFASAWGFLELLCRIHPRLAGMTGLASGLALVGLQAFLVPIPLGDLFGTFTNHKSWLVPEPSLARPFSKTPEIYHELARSPRALTVVEFPLTMQSVMLFDNYQRQHAQRALVGLTTGIEGVYSRRPYVSLLELDPAHTDIDWVIVHKDVRREVEAFLAEASPLRRAVDEGPIVDERSTKRLRASLGEPTFEDEFVQAWKIAHAGEGERDGR